MEIKKIEKKYTTMYFAIFGSVYVGTALALFVFN